MYFENFVASRYRDDSTGGWTTWVNEGVDLSLYLTKIEAGDTYATLEQVGDIDVVLGILTGDISGDIDLAIQEMQGV